MTTLKVFAKDESGATAIEYGLIAALVAVAAILGMQALGTELNNIFNTVADELEGAQGGGAAPAP
jgi:pilus assembly protein Flp/PilA